MALRNATREFKRSLCLLQKSYYSTRVGLESSPLATGVRGKTFLISGATSGIGLTTAELLAQQGAIVLVAGRVFLEEKEVTSDGLEMTWAVNTASPFILTAELLPAITGKIVNCSSIGLADQIELQDAKKYERSGHAAYGNSKLALNMWSYRLAEKLKSTGSSVTVNCVDPGTVSTKLLYAGWGDVSYVALPAEEAHDVFWAATNSSLDGVSGSYFVNRKSSRSPSVSYDSEMQKKVWDLLVAQTGATYNFDGKNQGQGKNSNEGGVEKSNSQQEDVTDLTKASTTAAAPLQASGSQINSSSNLQELVC
ncbi:hypothetical protein Ndes2526B_g06860 [Nannochloris sp. 'desiccata']